VTARLARATIAAALLFAAGWTLAANPVPPPPSPEPCREPDRPYAADFTTPALLSSPLHKVAPCAEIRGHMARFRLETLYGPLVANSLELLEIRVEELPALEQVYRITRSKMFLDAAGDATKRTMRTLGRVVLNPVETVKNLPRGAVRYVRTKWRDVKHRSVELSERARDRASDADDPFEDTPPIPGGEREPRPQRTEAQRNAQQARKATLDYIGYYRARRMWARRLGVDPYSTNPYLRAKLDEIGWAAFLGGEAWSQALDAATGGASRAIGYTSRIDSVVWDLKPEAIAERSRQRLTPLGCGTPKEIRRYLRNRAFNPSLQVAFTDEIVELAFVRGCADLIVLAGAAQNEIEARYLVNALRTVRAARTSRDEPLAARLVGAAIVIDRDPSASEPDLLLPLPVDRLRWTEATREFFDDPAFRVRDKTILIGGDATEAAMRGLTERGWHVVLRAPYENAPAYR
jgi:hypothetical protein